MNNFYAIYAIIDHFMSALDDSYADMLGSIAVFLHIVCPQKRRHFVDTPKGYTCILNHKSNHNYNFLIPIVVLKCIAI
jgi:hypothetical protein